jgi:hypothetical protein
MEELTWEAFKQKFLDKYFPKCARVEKKIQFLDMHQGSMAVSEYVAKFENREAVQTFLLFSQSDGRRASEQEV